MARKSPRRSSSRKSARRSARRSSKRKSPKRKSAKRSPRRSAKRRLAGIKGSLTRKLKSCKSKRIVITCRKSAKGSRKLTAYNRFVKAQMSNLSGDQASKFKRIAKMWNAKKGSKKGSRR